MSLNRFALQNPWVVLVGALIVTVLGLRAFFMMPTDYFPDTSPPQVAVITVEPGATAVDVARRITEVIEKELSSIAGLRSAFIALVSILLVVFLMGTFQSFVLPIPVLVAIPLSLIGSLWALLIFGQPMCMPAMMGIVLLAGIVINNSIFLIDFIKQARREGMEREDALIQSVRLRLRPVLMTTVSTFVGMLPIILETAIGLERMSPLATAAGFGLLAGTFMTMIVTPVFYSILDDAKTALRGFWQRS